MHWAGVKFGVFPTKIAPSAIHGDDALGGQRGDVVVFEGVLLEDR